MLATHTSVFCYYQNQHKKPDRRDFNRRGYKVSLTVWSISWSKGYSVPLLTPASPCPFGLQTFQKFLAEHKNKFTRKRVIFHLSTTLNPMKRKAKLQIISLITPIPISTTVNLHLAYFVSIKS